MGGVGFEPTQREAPGLQPGPALQLRRPPLVAIEGYAAAETSPQIAFERLASPLVSMRLGFEPPFRDSDVAERPGRQQPETEPS